MREKPQRGADIRRELARLAALAEAEQTPPGDPVDDNTERRPERPTQREN